MSTKHIGRPKKLDGTKGSKKTFYLSQSTLMRFNAILIQQSKPPSEVFKILVEIGFDTLIEKGGK